MEQLLASAGLIAVGAIAPGPNNLVVLRLAARNGLAAAAPAIAGIVLGGLAVLFLVYTGVEALLAEVPALGTGLAASACAYIAWIGARMMLGSRAAASAPDGKLPLAPVALFAFQLVQPGPWLLAVASITAVGSTVQPLLARVLLAGYFAFIPAICLLLWSLMGRLVARPVEDGSGSERFDRVLGALLFGLAVVLLLRGLQAL